MAIRGGGLAGGPIGPTFTGRSSAAGARPTWPAATSIGATEFSEDPAVVVTGDTESVDWAGTGHGQWPIVGPPVRVWCRMQQLWPPSTAIAHGDATAAGTPLR